MPEGKEEWMKKMVTFGVITKIESDDKFNCGNHACGCLLINPDGDKHLAGSTYIVEPSIPIKEYEKLLSECLKDESAICIRKTRLETLDLTRRQLVTCLTPVFKLGEILVIGNDDRTIPDGRKPSKWFVTCEYFNDIELAVKRSKEAVDNDP